MYKDLIGFIVPSGRVKVDELERGSVHVFKVDGDNIPPTMALKIEDEVFVHTIELVYSKEYHRQSVEITRIVRKVEDRPHPNGYIIEKSYSTYRERVNYRVQFGVNLFADDAWNKLREYYKPAIMHSRWHTADVAMSAKEEADVIAAIGQG
jgi:hypothetical protein